MIIKLLKTIILLLVIFTIFSPTASFANEADSVTYKVAGNLIDVTERFSLNLADKIAAAYRSIYISLATIGMIFIFTQYLFTRVVPIMDTFYFMIAIIISGQIAFNPQVFKAVIYDPYFQTLYGLDKFIIQTSAEQMQGVAAVRFTGISGMFKTVDMTFADIYTFCNYVTLNAGWSMIPVAIQALIIFILYIFLGAYFLVIFTVSIIGAHMMLILLPVAISLYPFKKFRGYMSNLLHSLLHYGLVTVFACIAIGIVIFICNDLAVEARRLVEVQEGSIPTGFLIQSIMIGFLSIFLLKMSSEFASRVSNTASSQLGGAFPMVVGGAVTAAKGVAAAAPYAAKGAMNTYSAGASSGKWAYGQLRSTFAPTNNANSL